jgi:hypothetical protein
MSDMDLSSHKNEKLRDFLPVTLFVALTFLLEVFGLGKATNLVISVFISLFIFGVQAAMLREKYGDLPELKILQKKIGLLSFIFLCILGVAFLHWYQILHVNLRWSLFFVFLIIYFFLLFTAVNNLHHIRIEIKKGNN